MHSHSGCVRLAFTNESSPYRSVLLNLEPLDAWNLCQGGFSCSLNSMPSMPSTSSEMRRSEDSGVDVGLRFVAQKDVVLSDTRTHSRATKPTKGLGR